MSVQLGTGILYPALRIAGITLRPGRTPSGDQSAEAIAILNRMIGSWNCDPLDIFTYTIQVFPLAAGQEVFQMGVGAPDFNVPAPQQITQANIIVPGTPPVRYQMRIVQKAQWAEIMLQAIPGAIPNILYPDYNFPITSLYIYPQAPAGYQIELYTPQLVPTFVTTSDTVTLPPGYEEALVANLAVKIAKAYPLEATLTPEMISDANSALAAIESRNAPVPRLKNDAARLAENGRGGDWNWWRTGGYGT